MSGPTIGQAIVDNLRKQREAAADQAAELAAQVDVLRHINAGQAERIKELEAGIGTGKIEYEAMRAELTKSQAIATELARRLAEVEPASTSTDSVAK